MKWFKRIGISLCIALFAACCGAVLLFNWSAFGWKALSVQTGSMRPAIPQGSLVLMHRVPNSSLKVGDVITYISPRLRNTTITHRIVKTYSFEGKIPAYITKGDANQAADTPVLNGMIQGKAVWYIPYLGKFMDWSRTWVGLAILVYLPALLMIFEEVLRLSKYYSRAKLYKWAGILAKEAEKPKLKLAQASIISVIMVAGSIFIAFPVQALLRSNTVAIGPNHISVAPKSQNCTTSGNNMTIVINGSGGNNTDNVNVSNTNNQTATTGNASSTSDSATSGNATNTNCTNINIHITNH